MLSDDTTPKRNDNYERGEDNMTVEQAWIEYQRKHELNRWEYTSTVNVSCGVPPLGVSQIEQAFRAAHELGYIAGMKMQRTLTRLNLGLEERE